MGYFNEISISSYHSNRPGQASDFSYKTMFLTVIDQLGFIEKVVPQPESDHEVFGESSQTDMKILL